MIISNQARCLDCKDEPFSAHRHDFKYCKCENIFVDGGCEYLRHGYVDRDKYENMSIEVDEDVVTAMLEALEWCDNNKRNNLGRVCAVFRAMRDTGFLDKIM